MIIPYALPPEHCPNCKGNMPRGNKFCSLRCYNIANGIKEVEVEE